MSTFTRQERLKSRKTIGRLFKEGNSYVAYPLRAVWVKTSEATKSEAGKETDKQGLIAQIVVSVPKKHFKTAVLRNRLKRRILEAYRLNKQELYSKLPDASIALMLMYVAKEELPYSQIEAGVKKMMRKFPG